MSGISEAVGVPTVRRHTHRQEEATHFGHLLAVAIHIDSDFRKRPWVR